MAKTFGTIVLLLLAGCSTVPQVQFAASPCAAGEATSACQVERYHNINTP